MASTRRSGGSAIAIKFAAVYLAFGIGFEVVQNAFCNYRVKIGNPPDVSCFDPLLAPMELLVWPLPALGDAMQTGRTVLPASWYRMTGAAFLIAFAAALVWVFHRPHQGDRTG